MFLFINNISNLLFVHTIYSKALYLLLNSAAQQRIIDELKEKQFNYQQDSNKILREISSLQEKLNLHE